VSDGGAADTTSFNVVIAPPALVTVNLQSSGFTPSSVAIRAGAQVKWVKIAGGNHTTTNGTGPLDPAAGTLWDAQLRSTSPQFLRAFPTGGTFPYFCRNHPSETGTITVDASQIGIDETVSPRFMLTASPNPFRSGIDLQFEIERAEHVSVTVMDLQGRKVRNLVAGEFPAGTHRVFWEGRDDNRAPVGPGLYFARLVTGNGEAKVQKLFKIR
jgi:plastocyanin